MLLVRFFIMRFAPALLAALGIVAVCLPAQAQEKVTRLDHGFSYVIPSEYKTDPKSDPDGLFGDTLVDLIIKEGSLDRTIAQNSSGYVNMSILSSITVTTISVEKIIIIPGDDKPDPNPTSVESKNRITERAKRFVSGMASLFKLAHISLDYQNSAPIKVSGQDAIAVRCNSFVEGSDTEYTVRFIFLIRNSKLYTFLFASKNDEFEEKVGAFDKFMKSFKFLTPPGAKPTPAPKKPKKK